MTSLTTTTTNCSICFQNVTPQQPAIILNKSKTTECKLHSACFNCIECSTPLLNTPGARTTTTLEYRAKGGDLDNALNDTAVVPLCNEHYLKKFGTFCSHCNEIVTGSFLKVGTEKYHPNCMLCSNCSIPVNTKDEPAKISNDIIRCTNCFNDVMYDKCVGCRKPCNAQFIKYGTVTKDDGTTEEGKYHPDCFSCTNCDVSLGGLKFIPSKNNPNSIFCESCYQQVNAPICTICSHCILETNFLNLEGGKPCHELCLSCSICSMPARDPATDQLHIHSQDGVFYCKTHYVEKFAEKCFGCSFGIDGTYLNAMNKRWHKECFCCFACGDALTKANGGSTEYCVENNEVYCLNDWDGLFGNGLNGSAENTSVAKKEDKKEEEEEDQEDQEDQDYQEDQGKEEVNRDTTYTTDQLNLPGDDTAATSSTPSTASTASSTKVDRLGLPPKYTAPLPPPRKKPNSRHVRKKSQIDEIRTSALATSALCRSSTGGLGDVSETKTTATATNNNNEKKTKPRKTSKRASLKNKKDPQWGKMIGTLFSQGIGHAVRTHNERKGKADLALIEKKEYKARFPYRLENSREMIHNDAEETSSNSNVNNPLNGVDVGQNRSATTTTIKSKFDFEDFAPSCFTHLRTTWGISDVNYMNSMCRHPLSGGQVGEGKSGMLFFFSSDKKYIVKTVTTSELPFFLRIMNDYHSHMLQCPNSLLSRFMGLYRMKGKYIITLLYKSIYLDYFRNLIKTYICLSRRSS